MDEFNEISEASWFERIKGAIVGVGIGLILIIVSVVLLFWNEGRSVQRYRVLQEGKGKVISVDVDKVIQGNDDKLVYLTGKAVTDNVVKDSEFGIELTAIKLHRIVEMYQWEEESESDTQKKLGGGTKTVTRYTYQKGWSEELIDSSGFKETDGHVNPSSMPYSSHEDMAEDVKVGAFSLSASLIRKFSGYKELPFKGYKLPESLAGKAEHYSGGIYIGANPAQPKIGDMKVSFEVVYPSQVSIVARQASGILASYETDTGGSIELLHEGVLSAKEMFRMAEESNIILTWVLRLVGFILMLIGINLFLGPLSVFADVIPFIGDIVGAGTFVISILFSGIFSLAIICIAWFFYRPVIGVLLIAGCCGLAFMVKKRINNKKNKAKDARKHAKIA